MKELSDIMMMRISTKWRRQPKIFDYFRFSSQKSTYLDNSWVQTAFGSIPFPYLDIALNKAEL